MKVEVIDRRYRGCAVGCDQCHTCRIDDELRGVLELEKRAYKEYRAARFEKKPIEYLNYLGIPF
jgi:hypothetical protein